VAAVAGLLLEEFGHKIDRVLNGNIDSPGDEGAIFRSLVTGQSLSTEMFVGLRSKDDRSTILLDGKAVEVEKQDFFGDAGGIVTNDSISGTAGDDNISGLGGNDRLSGLDGNDTVNGGDGIDRLFGGNGNDILNGDAGNDDLNSDAGNDNINGGAGFDTYSANYSDRLSGLTMIFDSATGNGTITVGTETDTLNSIENLDFFIGTNFDDTLLGSASRDFVIRGGAGNDSISGNGGDDYLLGDDGNDNVNGGDDNDDLFGGNGNDILNGDAGNDRLTSDAGNDAISGGAGNDTYDANYSDRLSGLTMTFDSATGNGTITVGTETDTLNSIENLMTHFWGVPVAILSYAVGRVMTAFRAMVGMITSSVMMVMILSMAVMTMTVYLVVMVMTS
jgi:Ca2+-binding RTX toxin-like protein